MRDSRTASRSSCSAKCGTASGSSRAACRRVSAAAWMDAAGVFNSCEAFATKSLLTASRRRASVTSPMTTTTDPSAPGRRGDAQPSGRRSGLDLGDLGVPVSAVRRIISRRPVREHLRERLGTCPEVPLDRVVGERRAPAAIQEEHALLHRAEDAILHPPLFARCSGCAPRARRTSAGWLPRGRGAGPSRSGVRRCSRDAGDRPGHERACDHRRAHRAQCRGHLSCGFASAVRSARTFTSRSPWGPRVDIPPP